MEKLIAWWINRTIAASERNVIDAYLNTGKCIPVQQPSLNIYYTWQVLVPLIVIMLLGPVKTFRFNKQRQASDTDLDNGFGMNYAVLDRFLLEKTLLLRFLYLDDNYYTHLCEVKFHPVTHILYL